MKRTSMNFMVMPFLGRWDIGGALSLIKNESTFFLKPATQFKVGLLFLYLLVRVAAPGIGAFTSQGMYALIDALRESQPLMPVVVEFPRFSVVFACYCFFLLAYPIWALLFRAKRMVSFSIKEREIVLGYFRRFKARRVKQRFSFDEICEIEILHTRQQYRGSGGHNSGRAPAMKDKYFLSVISNRAEEPAYIIQLPKPEPLTVQLKEITQACALPLVFESFPE